MDAAGMIAMTVGDEDGRETCAVLFQEAQHRHGVARIDDDHFIALAQRPDVIVLESRDGFDLHGERF